MTHNIAQHSTAQTAQHSTAQLSTAQLSTVQHSTAQHSTRTLGQIKKHFLNAFVQLCRRVVVHSTNRLREPAPVFQRSKLTIDMCTYAIAVASGTARALSARSYLFPTIASATVVPSIWRSSFTQFFTCMHPSMHPYMRTCGHSHV